MTIEVQRDERGKWWVVLDGVRVSDHSTHVAARRAAQNHVHATAEGGQA